MRGDLAHKVIIHIYEWLLERAGATNVSSCYRDYANPVQCKRDSIYLCPNVCKNMKEHQLLKHAT